MEADNIIMLKYAWFLVMLILAGSLLRTLWLSWQSRQTLTEQEQRVGKLEQQTSVLEDEVRTATDSFTLEKRAREELQLRRAGETIILIKP